MMWANFKRQEFKCSCCGEEAMRDDFIDKLQKLRDYLGFPLKITSGYRCGEHPVEVKKSTVGTHRQGIAADIAVSREQAYRVVCAAKEFGFTGIGVAQKGNCRFIHLDARDNPTIWSY